MVHECVRVENNKIRSENKNEAHDGTFQTLKSVINTISGRLL